MIRRASAAELAAAALSYAELGWQVVPLHELDARGRCSCGRDCDTSAGKHPRLPEWQRHATHDAEKVRGYWRKWPAANVGVRLGSGSSLVGIDIDPPNGEAHLLALSDGDLPPTLEMLTGKGRRLLYAIPDCLEVEPRTVCFRDEGERETVRLQGGANSAGESRGYQCVVPPSWHPLGRPYVWMPGRGPGEVEPAPMPGWCVALMCPAAEPAFRDPPREAGDGSEPWAQFNLRADWFADVLAPAGGKRCGRAGAVEYATRPGKAGGVSASVGHYTARDGSPALHVFTSNWPGLEPDRTYDKFGAWVRLFHRGDFAAATRDAVARGFGTPLRRPRPASAAAHTLEQRVEQLEWLVAELLEERERVRS